MVISSSGNRKTSKSSIPALLPICIRLHPLPPLHFSHPTPHEWVPQSRAAASSQEAPSWFPGLCARPVSVPLRPRGCQNTSERLRREHCYLYPRGLMSTSSKGEEHNGERQELDYRGVFLERDGENVNPLPPQQRVFIPPLPSRNPDGRGAAGIRPLPENSLVLPTANG